MSENKEIELGEATAVSYNPKIGFILHYPNPYFEDQFECKATSPEGKEETQVMFLKYLSKFLFMVNGIFFSTNGYVNEYEGLSNFTLYYKA